jgi:hypothetical protein
MALLTKLQSTKAEEAQVPPRTNWVLYLTSEELAELAGGADVAFGVSVPKDTPLVDTVARVVVRRMPAEMADRHRVTRETPSAVEGPR